MPIYCISLDYEKRDLIAIVTMAEQATETQPSIEKFMEIPINDH